MLEVILLLLMLVRLLLMEMDVVVSWVGGVVLRMGRRRDVVRGGWSLLVVAAKSLLSALGGRGGRHRSPGRLRRDLLRDWKEGSDRGS